MNNVALVVFLVFIVGVAYLMMRITRSQRRQTEDDLPAWRQTPLTKEQQSIVKEQYTAYKAEAYKDYPEAAQFEKNRHKWAIFIVLVYLITSIVRSWTEITTDVNLNVNTSITVVVALASCFVGILLLFASIENRKLTVLLYVIGFVQLVSYVQSLSEFGINSLAMFVQIHVAGFKYSPGPALSNVLSIITTMLLLITAVRYTVIRRNRELAEIVEMLNEKINKEFEPTGI